MSEAIKALVVIPTYNEADNIERLCRALCENQRVARVLVVDDSSPDGTAEKAQALTGKLPVSVLKREKKNGRGGAVLDGFAWGEKEGGFTHFVEMDSDFSHDPEELDLLLDKAGEFGVVIGSRYIPGARIENWPLKRRIFSYCANLLCRFLLKVPVKDYTDGYRVYSAAAVGALDRSQIAPKGFITLSAMLMQLYLKGFSATEVPIRFVNRIRGESNLNKGEITEALRNVFQLRKLRIELESQKK